MSVGTINTLMQLGQEFKNETRFHLSADYLLAKFKTHS